MKTKNNKYYVIPHKSKAENAQSQRQIDTSDKQTNKQNQREDYYKGQKET